MRYAYTGNVHYGQGDSSYCHHCHNQLIGRDWYVMTDWQLTEQGTCRFCGTPVAGVFEPSPGNWGARRMPVRLKDYAAAR
jgi:pyruvate formate lyase activating enzyme